MYVEAKDGRQGGPILFSTRWISFGASEFIEPRLSGGQVAGRDLRRPSKPVVFSQSQPYTLPMEPSTMFHDASETRTRRHALVRQNPATGLALQNRIFRCLSCVRLGRLSPDKMHARPQTHGPFQGGGENSDEKRDVSGTRAGLSDLRQ